MTSSTSFFSAQTRKKSSLNHESYPNTPNGADIAGSLITSANDTWFGADGLQWYGENVTYLYVWGVQLVESEPNATVTAETFSVIREYFNDSLWRISSVYDLGSASIVETTILDSVRTSLATASPASTPSQQTAFALSAAALVTASLAS